MHSSIILIVCPILSLTFQISSNDSERNGASVSSPERAGGAENCLRQAVAELDPSIRQFFHEEYVPCEGHYTHINRILKEAHFNSLRQRRQHPT